MVFFIPPKLNSCTLLHSFVPHLPPGVFTPKVAVYGRRRKTRSYNRVVLCGDLLI
jgi:hypothetical protein